MRLAFQFVACFRYIIYAFDRGCATLEIFIDYGKYFAKIIKLNSHVLTCVETGRSGLTNEEVVESKAKAAEEEKVAEILAAINNLPSCQALVTLQSPGRSAWRIRMSPRWQ